MDLKVGVVGVGPVGDRIIRVLKERQFPVHGVPLVMATRERRESLADQTFQVKEIRADLFDNLDVAFFAGKEGAKGASVQWGKIANERGCVVIDNGGDFRMNPDYPLVIPEVNMNVVTSRTKHICSPNCSTTQMVVALAPLHRAFQLKRVIVSTYQSVSGWGGAAQEQLQTETKNFLAGEKVTHDPAIFSRQIAFDCLPHIDRFLENGYTKEEMKMVNETRKILNIPDLRINATAVRVPVFVGHSESINAEFSANTSADQVREILSDPKESPGVIVMDQKNVDSEDRTYPVTRDLEKPAFRDSVLVGRIRDDITLKNTVSFWCVSDNLRKGAATNVVQIAEGMIQRGFF